ncbi:hypothetical protein BH10PSE8_BH10PSE8_11200 [soil metagenome]
MTVETPFLRGLRRSTLGAWLAVAYALAVLASGLAPSPAIAHSPLDGAWLCSGLAAPTQGMPEPASEPAHCKGCPVNPVLAGRVDAAVIADVRTPLSAASEQRAGFAALPAAVPWLPPSRAPPASTA